MGAAGFTHVTVCPRFPVNRYPETADAALLPHARATVTPPEQDGVATFLEALVSARS